MDPHVDMFNSIVDTEKEGLENYFQGCTGWVCCKCDVKHAIF